MNPMRRSVRHLAIAAAAALSMAVASPSSARQHIPDWQHQEHAHDAAAQPERPADDVIKRHEDAMARRAAIDNRIDTLVADMNMFTGELKVVAMAALLTAIVERQSVMSDEMRRMHDSMIRRVMESPSTASAADEPGTMCAPSP